MVAIKSIKLKSKRLCLYNVQKWSKDNFVIKYLPRNKYNDLCTTSIQIIINKSKYLKNYSQALL